MPRTKIITGDQPRLNDQETTTLQSHVEDWEKASGTERQQIFKAAAREAKLFAPKMDKELLKQRKEVSFSALISVMLHYSHHAHRDTGSGSTITRNPRLMPKCR
jgi:hypothetical protein